MYAHGKRSESDCGVNYQSLARISSSSASSFFIHGFLLMISPIRMRLWFFLCGSHFKFFFLFLRPSNLYIYHPHQIFINRSEIFFTRKSENHKFSIIEHLLASIINLPRVSISISFRDVIELWLCEVFKSFSMK